MNETRAIVDSWPVAACGNSGQVGRTFLRRLFNLNKAVSHPDHHVRLSTGATSDLAWWQLCLESWNGILLMSAAHKRVPEVTFTSDASGTWVVVDIGMKNGFS